MTRPARGHDTAQCARDIELGARDTTRSKRGAREVGVVSRHGSLCQDERVATWPRGPATRPGRRCNAAG